MKTKIIVSVFMLILPSLALAAVDLITGAYVHRVRLTLPESDGEGLPLTIQYSSRSLWTTNLGFGWCGEWNTEIEALGPGRYRLRECAGDVLLQSQTSADGVGERFLSALGDELKINAQGIWLFHRSGVRARFSMQGQIQERFAGEQVERFQYDGFGRLRVWSKDQRRVIFSYQGLQRQARALGLSRSQAVRLLQRNGNLEAVLLEPMDLRFEYDDLNNLTIIRSGDQAQERIQYDRWQDRVVSVGYSARQEVWAFFYIASKESAAVARVQIESPEHSITYSFEESGLLHAVVRQEVAKTNRPERFEFRYDESRMLNTIVAPNGQLIQLAYDPKGQLKIRETNPYSQQANSSLVSMLQGTLQNLAPFHDGDLVL